jgi:hypothetical protein
MMNERLPFRTYGSISFYDEQMTSIRRWPVVPTTVPTAMFECLCLLAGSQARAESQNRRSGAAPQRKK